MSDRPMVVLVCNEESRDAVLHEAALTRLAEFAQFRWEAADRPTSREEWMLGTFSPPEPEPDADALLVDALEGANAIIVNQGSPLISGPMMDALPGLRFLGELEGDRFPIRIDVEAAWERGIRTVDTTNGSSYGVSEWALAMTLIGLRNAGSLFRRMIIDKQEDFHSEYEGDTGFRLGELSGKRVGMIGCGIIGRRFLELLEPFDCEVLVHDPYVPRELADIYDVTFTSLDQVLSGSDVVVCLAPITPATRGMLGAREFGLMQDEAVFVNVSRGAIVQTDALIDKLNEGNLIACLDVFDPEPVPADSPIRDMPNVFLTPHIAGVNSRGGHRFLSLMVDELERFFAGHETRYDLLPRTIANRTGAEPPKRQ